MAKKEEEEEEEKEDTKKPKKQQIEDDDDDEVTQKKGKKPKGESKPQDEPILTISGAQKKPVTAKADLKLVHGCRVLTDEIKESFSKLDQGKLTSLATMNQVVHIKDQKTNIDFKNNESILNYIRAMGHNYAEAYTLDFLAQGGESYVLRADLKQPVEVVVKTVLPDNVTQNTMTSIISESHLVKLLDNKEHVVEIYEEIIEFNQTDNTIMNYLVIVEQAIQDLKKIVSYWIDEGKSLENLETYSDFKLFYFLYKAVEAVNYLHEQNIYYGDMKEANLLVFRDYSVKLGDFGVSMKLDEDEDPDEQVYELKGLTPGYTTLNMDDMYSKNKLFKNDYYALQVTFKNIQELVSAKCNKHGAGRAGTVFKLGYRKDSYFCQFFAEFEKLDPKTYNLRQVLDKYRDLVLGDQSFFAGFCEQLLRDEKYYAMPNVLKLWKHGMIPAKVQSYQLSAEYMEYPFLVLNQKSTIPEDEANYSQMQQSKVKQIQEDTIVKEIHDYIDSIGDKFVDEIMIFVNSIVSYKGYMPPYFSNSIYRKIFGKYFIFEQEGGQTISLMQTLEQNQEKIKELIPNKITFEILQQSSSIRTLCYFLLFIQATKNQNEVSYDEIMTKLISAYSLKPQKNPDYIECVKLVKGTAFLYNWDRLDRKLQYMIELEQLSASFKGCYSEDGSEPAIKFLSMSQLADTKEEKLKNLNRIKALVNNMKVFKKAISLPSVQKRIFSIQSEAIEDRQLCYKELTKSRDILKKTHGELGNEMSQNAYQLYSVIKELELQEKADEDLKQQGFNLLQKACNFSHHEQRQLFMMDLMNEYKLKGDLVKMMMTLAAYKQLNPLLYNIISKSFGVAQQVDDMIIQEFFQLKQVIRLQKMMGLVKVFGKMLTDYLEIPEEYKHFDYHLILKILKVKTLHLIIDELKKKGCLIGQDVSILGYKVSIREENGKQVVLVFYPDETSLEVELTNYVLNGNTKYQIAETHFYYERYENGIQKGQFNYKNTEMQVEGEFFSEKKQIGKITYLDGSIYIGELSYFLKNGNGKFHKFKDDGSCQHYKLIQNFYGQWVNNEFVNGRYEQIIKESAFSQFLYQQMFFERKPIGTTMINSEQGGNEDDMMMFYDQFGDIEVKRYLLKIDINDGCWHEVTDVGENTFHVLSYSPDGKLYEDTTVEPNKIVKFGQVGAKKVGKLIRYFPSGAKQEEGFYTSGFPDGEQTIFYENGQIAEKIIYVGRFESGPCQVYDKDGSLLGQYTFGIKKEERKGEEKKFTFDNQSIMTEQEEFQDGVSVSTKTYYPNGKLKSEKRGKEIWNYYENGNLESHEDEQKNQEYYNQAGQLIKEVKESKESLNSRSTFHNGQIKNQKFEIEGQQISEDYYNDGKVAMRENETTKEVEIFDKEGNSIAKGTTSDDLAIEIERNGVVSQMRLPGGEHQVFYPNSTKVRQIQNSQANTLKRYSLDQKYSKIANPDNSVDYFIDGNKVGQQADDFKGREGQIFYFLNSGQLMFIEEYKNDMIVSIQYFYPNGQLLRAATFQNNLIDGVEQVFFGDGKPYKTAEYANGKLHGKTFFFSKEGTVACAMEFNEGKVVNKQINHDNFKALEELQ